MLKSILDVNLKETAKKMSKRFACGASADSEGVIDVQGDVADEIIEYLNKEFKVSTHPIHI